MSQASSIRRVILPLDQPSDEQELLLPASVLASWFGTRLQLVTSDPAAVDRYEQVAAGIGVPTEPVISLGPDGFLANVAAHAEIDPPSVCVARADEAGVELAKLGSQATFLMGPRRGRRLSAGPLVLGLSGADSDVDALAVAAVWAQALDLQVRLVIDTDASSPDVAAGHARSAQERLREMGIEGEIDRVRGEGTTAALLVAQSRSATALVVAADHLADDGVVGNAADAGVSVLTASVGGPNPARRAVLDPGGVDDGPRHRRAAATPVGGDLLDGAACHELLAGRSVGRLGYIDDGWPVVVPVNYAVAGGDIFIRSLPGAKLAAAERDDIVCFEIDHVDPASMSGWSVLVHGPLELISDPGVLRLAWDNDPGPWIDADEWRWLRLRPLSLTGRTVPSSGRTEPAAG